MLPGLTPDMPSMNYHLVNIAFDDIDVLLFTC